MRRRIVIGISVVAVLVAVVVGVVVAAPSRVQATTAKLPALTPLELVSKAAASVGDVKAVHAQVTWTNGLLGEAFTLPAEVPAEVQALWRAGSGEVWFQDGSLRVEAGKGADRMTVVKNGDLLWVYSARTDTATQYTLPADGQTKDRTSSERSGFGPGGVQSGFPDGLAQLMSAITLNVTQDAVGGSEAYILTATPTATDTTLGHVSVAFDGTTYVPLRLQVFAKGATDPVLAAEVRDLSFDAIPASEFSFAAPAGASVEKKAVAAKAHDGQPEKAGDLKHNVPPALTLPEAQAKVDFKLASAAQPPAGLAFQDARVLPADKERGAMVALRYGSGLGTVMLAEGQLTADQQKQVLEHLAQSSVTERATVGLLEGVQVATPLVNAFVWTSDGVTHIAAGAVPPERLQSFVASLD